MKKNLLTVGVCAALFATALQVNAEPTMVATYKIGDSMGATGVTLKSVNLYDGENKIQRTYEIATDYNGDSYTETVITYTYNERGLLERSCNDQYQPAYGKWERKDECIYQYDEQGRLVKEDTSNRGNQYFFNEQGYKYRETYYSNTTPTTIQDISYFDFDANGNPARAESDGYQSDYRFDAVYSYDAMGRCIDIMRHCVIGTVHSRDTYAYDEAGVLIDKYEYMSAYGKGSRESGQVGGTKDTLRYNYHTERTALGNGWYNKITWTWDTILKMWTKGSTTYNELYVNLDGAYAPRNAVAENISTEERPNTVKVTCDVPATLPVEKTSYVIWRNGMMMATVEAVDGKIEYIEENVPNASYEYYVQSYDAANDVYYNVSNVAPVDVKMPLSYAENIRVAGGYHGTYNDPDAGTYDTFYIKLAWDVKPCDDPVLGYKVWVYPWAYPLVEISGDVKECDLSMVDDEVASIRVDVVYEHGVQQGEYVTLFWDNSADFEGEPMPTYYLTHEVKYGDSMGTTRGASGINYYLYDNNNNLSRRIDYGYQTDGTAVPTYHYFYEYNNNAQLISEFYRQMNGLGEWSKNKMTYVYTYDQYGRLATKEDTLSFRLYEYFYDFQGRLTSMTDKTRTFGSDTYDKLNSTTNYVSYDEKGNPTYVEYVHHTYASSCYNTTYTYDENGRVLVQEARTPEGLAYEKFEYTYDKYGVVTMKVRSMPWYDEETYKPTANFVPSTRTVREAQGNMVYKTYDENYTAKNDTWTNSNGRYSMETYSALCGNLTPQNLVVTDASTAESPNTIKVECNFPKIRLANAQYIIWRGCTPVDTVTATAAQGIIRFKDENVENGTYEYIVQTYDAVSQQAFNATAPCVYTLNAKLEPVQNLRYIATVEGVYRDADVGELPAYWVHFEWDAPQSALEVIQYNVYQDGYKIPISETTNTNDSVWVYREDAENFASQEKTTFVEVAVVYALGVSEAQSATFELEFSATDKVSYEGSAYVAGKTLYTEPNATVVLYNAAGVVVATYNNKQQYDLSALVNGVYVATVKVDNNVQVVKIAL